MKAVEENSVEYLMAQLEFAEFEIKRVNTMCTDDNTIIYFGTNRCTRKKCYIEMLNNMILEAKEKLAKITEANNERITRTEEEI